MTGTPTIPFNALGRAVQVQRDALDAAIGDVLDSGWFVMGPQHDGFERELAAYLGVDHCVAVANGTDALELALLSVGCRPGDTVVAAANAGGYGTAAARKLGLHVRYADVDAETLQMDTTSLAAVLAQPARAVVLTHLYGHMAPVEQVRALCDAHGVALVEDCAQAAGAHRDGRNAGSFGDAATFSFYPTKNLGALGDGGAVVTPDASRAQELRRLRQYGWSQRYVADTPGGRNSRLDEMQAAVLRVRLPLLDAGNGRRRDIAQAYAKALGRHQGAGVRRGRRRRAPGRRRSRRPGGLHGAARRGRRRLGRALPARRPPAAGGAGGRGRRAAPAHDRLGVCPGGVAAVLPRDDRRRGGESL